MAWERISRLVGEKRFREIQDKLNTDVEFLRIVYGPEAVNHALDRYARQLADGIKRRREPQR